MGTETFSSGNGESGLSGSVAWSRRAQIAFVGLAMPVLVFLLVIAPYLLSHYVVNRHYRFNFIPPPARGRARPRRTLDGCAARPGAAREFWLRLERLRMDRGRR